ncbi:MAG: universal stress protein [Flavobacteriales bacterium]|nr:universal stress protein [Flavobacteriales bacterium]
MNDLLCPVDLSGAALVAADLASDLARRTGGEVTLLHVTDRKEESEDAAAALEAFRSRTNGQAPMRTLLRNGDFLEEIGLESARGHALLVCGTHGARGLRQTLLGADILKLIRRSAVPSMVVQEHSTTAFGNGPLVMPVSGHANTAPLLDAVCMLARLGGNSVQVYQIMRPGESPSDQLLENKRKALYRLQEEGIRHEEVNEPMQGFSVGFAMQTIAHAARAGAACIAIMAHASDEYRWIADAEKERLLTNEPGIPVLCV